MGAVLYYGFCLVATVAILAGLSHYVIWPWAKWSSATFGWWGIGAILATVIIAYPFAIRAERRIAIERGLKPPRHLWHRHPDAPPLTGVQKVGLAILGSGLLAGIVAAFTSSI